LGWELCFKKYLINIGNFSLAFVEIWENMVKLGGMKFRLPSTSVSTFQQAQLERRRQHQQTRRSPKILVFKLPVKNNKNLSQCNTHNALINIGNLSKIFVFVPHTNWEFLQIIIYFPSQY
jgi:hypothetical protein